ncbi:MAG: hypothetical protein HY824_03285, partial [Acidobacteria bacterium]|nr:hypothetical protein [Acidobacteriota bacterium]
MRTRVGFLAAATAAVWLVQPGSAYWLNGPRWASGSGIVMHMQLGSSGGTLLDGTTSWNASAEGALARWNQVLSGVSFRVVRDSTQGIAWQNGVNNVFWGDDVYGDPFGDAIAYTKWVYRNDGTMIETDVVFDRRESWNSYRGNLRASGGNWL